MQALVVIIEDMEELSKLFTLYLEREGMTVKCFQTAEAGLSFLAETKADLVVLDINLPGMDGLEFLQYYRKNHSGPVLIVSARTSDEDIISGLGYGADEFATKPISPRVLVARVRALLRRNEKSADNKTNQIFFGPFSYDMDSFLLKKGDQKIPLSAKELEILNFLISQKGRPCSPEDIYKAVWDNRFGDQTAVAVYIQRLRRKIENDPANPIYLENVFGLGYRINL